VYPVYKYLPPCSNKQIVLIRYEKFKKGIENIIMSAFYTHCCMHLYSEVRLTTETVIIYPLLIILCVPLASDRLYVHVPVYVSGWDQSQSLFENTQITNFKVLVLSQTYDLQHQTVK